MVGPTAVGKTEIAVDVARHLGTEIISVDSRQMYREMCIGSAVPSKPEQGGIKHHFIHSHSIQSPLSAGQFAKEALPKVQELIKQHGTCVLAGGSGLYLKALAHGLNRMPPIPDQLRNRLQDEWNSLGPEAMLNRLKQSDPDYYEVVDRKNPRRVLRALEVVETTGTPYTHFRRQKQEKRNFQTIYLGLHRSREDLTERIHQRVDRMLESGLVREASDLMVFKDQPPLQTVGYQEVFGYLEGLYDEEEMVRLLKRNTRRYARRQLTWFRRIPGITWFHPDQQRDQWVTFAKQAVRLNT